MSRRRSSPTVASRLIDLGVFEVAISDTIGIAHPGQVPRVLEPVLARVPVDRIALHFHDTRGTALANVLAALAFGVTTFDASAGGLGGCPYAPGAAGNLATDDLIYMLDGLGIDTGVSLTALSEASAFIADRLDHPLPSRYAQAVAAGSRRSLKRLDDFFERHHVDGVVVGRAPELALLRRGRISERDTQSAADAQVGANGAHHPAVAIGFFDNAAGNRAGGLTDRAGERAEAADRGRLPRSSWEPSSEARPSSWSTLCRIIA